MKSFEDIKQIYCINLQHRTDRKDDCIQIFNKIGLEPSNIEFIQAHNGPELFPDQNKKRASKLGCTLSHIDAIKKMHSQNIKYGLILEDDFICDDNLVSKFNEYCEQIPEDFCILYLGANHKLPTIQYSKNIVKCQKSHCAHAYIVNQNYISNILDGDIFKYPVIDVYFSNYIQSVYPCYCLEPRLVWQRASYSDIEHRTVYYWALK